MIETFGPIVETASIVLQQDGGTAVDAAPTLTDEGARSLAIGVAIGLAALATGYAQRGIGSAAVGAVAEDSENFINVLIFTALPETLIIIAFVTVFVL
jgi:V/A-type H+-transporting ATPase subunit K